MKLLRVALSGQQVSRAGGRAALFPGSRRSPQLMLISRRSLSLGHEVSVT